MILKNSYLDNPTIRNNHGTSAAPVRPRNHKSCISRRDKRRPC